ncbi:hypothetical protein A359_08030 [secondary endosymbiont of Ctenarytaina eucalypti]|uniref:Uncharacterized protein n=1 Tax=secondary endosymbiont of Ctenarytaina eucalypti TaxID=1199245 RepID=J3VT81_9ENTR|nr:hypothetical protein A359_08030 [secondary endosymbiont of Ctenarytaina eucalypti]
MVSKTPLPYLCGDEDNSCIYTIREAELPAGRIIKWLSINNFKRCLNNTEHMLHSM